LLLINYIKSTGDGIDDYMDDVSIKVSVIQIGFQATPYSRTVNNKYSFDNRFSCLCIKLYRYDNYDVYAEVL